MVSMELDQLSKAHVPYLLSELLFGRELATPQRK